jgi:NitT/TauT family transport system ATP-binding protein
MISSAEALAASPAEPHHIIKTKPSEGRVRIAGVSILFGRGEGAHLAVDDTSLEIEPGEFVCLLGPSGCGKSTLLNCVAGYERPTVGEVTVDAKAVAGPGPERGMVFQQYSLFPWKTVLGNVMFGPRQSGKSLVESEQIARSFLAMVGLSAFAKSYPVTLSGGMKQRVGIARALANYPKVLLMDEPFGALDAQTRAMMQESLLRIWEQFGITVLFVTHDVDEAVFLADRVVVMSASPGRIIADLAVPLARPREPEMLTGDGFNAVKKRCLELIRAESLRAFEQQNRGRSGR